MFVDVSSAQAQQKVLAENFFDFEYAKTVWNEFTLEQLNTYFAKQCPPGGPDDAWVTQYRRDPQQALKALEKHPKSELIKRCYDTQLTYEVWSEMYGRWRGSLSVYGGKGWNDCRPGAMGLLPIMLREMNIFTGKCDDMPDWRHPKNVKEDDAAMSKGNASSWSRKKKKQ